MWGPISVPSAVRCCVCGSVPRWDLVSSPVRGHCERRLPRERGFLGRVRSVRWFLTNLSGFAERPHCPAGPLAKGVPCLHLGQPFLWLGLAVPGEQGRPVTAGGTPQKGFLEEVAGEAPGSGLALPASRQVVSEPAHGGCRLTVGPSAW